MNLPIYLDNNATTPVDPRVLDAMLPYFSQKFGNSASRGHSFGWDAEEAVALGRSRVAALLNADPREIIWTSGATESDNLAVKGVAEAYAFQGRHLVTAKTEHHAVLDSAKHLEQNGWIVTYLSVDRNGLIDLGELQDALTERTALVSIMLGNNETGTMQPITAIGDICRARDILFHTDATQAVGKMLLDVQTLPVDLISLTAHKMYGPKGIGALYVRRKNPRVRLTAQMDGGGHERGFRSGTLNVTGIVGFGMAAELCRQEMTQDQAHTSRLRDRLANGILSNITNTDLNGHPEYRLPNTANIAFGGVDSDAMMLAMPEVALSSGSACSSASLAPSHVLLAMGLGETRARSSLRFGVSRYTTEAEIDYVLEKIIGAVPHLRRLAPPPISSSREEASLQR